MAMWLALSPVVGPALDAEKVAVDLNRSSVHSLAWQADEETEHS
jgi:hypothetical protein